MKSAVTANSHLPLVSAVIINGIKLPLNNIVLMHQSVPPAPSPPPPWGYCGAFARLVSPGGGAFANFSLLGGRAFASPRAIPELLTPRGFLSEYNHTEGFTGKKADWLICQGQE